MPEPSPSRPRAIGIATAIMCALAGGALWCLLSLYSRGDLAGLAFLVALPVAWTLRRHGYCGHWSGALAAGTCVALAAFYSFYLQAVAQVAGMLGLPMRDALLRMSPSMAIDIARANVGTTSTVIVVAAIVVAAALVKRRA
ncbi:MAG: hypothetical protein ACTHK2_15075 [Dokdonella sp.]|uniref:hypothetical protein n=1 Tax=Dokdonella sp. TaxID=2291710 RepID=UPI003F7DF8DE